MRPEHVYSIRPNDRFLYGLSICQAVRIAADGGYAADSDGFVTIYKHDACAEPDREFETEIVLEMLFEEIKTEYSINEHVRFTDSMRKGGA